MSNNYIKRYSPNLDENLGFKVIYGGSANRISTALQIDIKVAEQLLKNYFNLFPELQVYIDNTSSLARYQKWVQCPITNRRYFVGEGNAHGIENDGATMRKGCNTIIQGLSSIMTKRAAHYIDQFFTQLNTKYKQHSSPGYIVGLVHDECITYIPGQGEVVNVRKDGEVYIPEYKFQDISYEYAAAQELGMKKAMDELLHKLVPDFPSKAECKLGTSWAAK